jgi:ATP-binding cassette, subfamily B, bacterial
VRNFDRVLVLHSGKVVQDGPPDQLVRHNGVYRDLVMREMDRLAKRAA